MLLKYLASWVVSFGDKFKEGIHLLTAAELLCPAVSKTHLKMSSAEVICRM